MIRQFDFKAWFKEKRSMIVRNHVIQLEMAGKDEFYDLEDLFLSWQIVPEKSRHNGAVFHGSITITETPQDVPKEIGPEKLVHEFRAEIDQFLDEYPGFNLYDLDEGSLLGLAQLHPDRLPEGIGEKGDQCYMTIRVEYDCVISEEEAEERRELMRERYERDEEMFSE